MQQSVTKKAPVKVNLHLGIHPGRDERGYHRADSVMCALDLGDAVTVERLCAPAPQSAAQRGVALDMSEDVGIDYARNTAWLAAVRAKEALGDEHHYCVRVTKGVIPQSGLGGSSSDAASTIMAILELCGESRREALAVQVARSIGADVPFFLNPVPSYLDGAGDVLKESFGRLGDVPVVLVRPLDGVSTAAAYGAFDLEPTAPVAPDAMLAALRAGDVQAVAEHLYNNLDPVARRLVPDDDVIAAWLAADGGVLGAQVSGSGSCVFAICRSHEDAGRLAGAARLRGWWSAATRML